MQGGLTIGIVGGGQLGRMLTLAAKPLGFDVMVLDEHPMSPAAQVGASEITANLYDKQGLQKLAEASDFITIEIEHLDVDSLANIAAANKPVNPFPSTIRIIQDKFAQKEFLKQNKIPTAPYVKINSTADAQKALRKFGGKLMLKARFGAYDGRGNQRIESSKKLLSAMKEFKDRPLYAEKLIPFNKELAVMVAKGTDGKIALYPVVETIHERNICQMVIVPARVSSTSSNKALKLAQKVAKQLEGAGVFGIEMFLKDDGDVFINEIAPRVHNSGHYTLEANQTSQFEQHIRAITGLPLGRTDLTVPAAVMINILGQRNGPTKLKGANQALAIPGVSIHWYGKSPTKIDRKMGHITAIGNNVAEAMKKAKLARKLISA